jgi:hypothetical protein
MGTCDAIVADGGDTVTVAKPVLGAGRVAAELACFSSRRFNVQTAA